MFCLTIKLTLTNRNIKKTSKNIVKQYKITTFAFLKDKSRMKIKYTFVIFLCAVLCALNVFSKDNVYTIVLQNVSLEIPEGWSVQKNVEKNGDFILNCTKDNSIAFVEVVCKRKVIALETRLNEIASSRSLQKNFDYMQIDEVQPVVFNKQKAKQLSYTNTYLNDVSKGGIYAFIFEGYTYSLEFFGEDNPKTRKELDKIVRSFKITAAKKEINIVEKEKEYQAQDWKKYDDTTSLETKVEEYGKDLATINTADNHKKAENYSSEEIKLKEKLSLLTEKKEQLQEQLQTAKDENNTKQEKKINKSLNKIEKEISKIEKKLDNIRTENLKIKLKEKDK